MHPRFFAFTRSPAVTAVAAALVLPLSTTPDPSASPAIAPAVLQQGPPAGVFLRLVEGIEDRAFDEVVAALRRGITSSGAVAVADYPTAVNQSQCAYRAHVFVIHAPDYAREVLARGAVAAFALPLRMAVYQDEAGVHITAVNPQSVTRTIVAETGFESQAAGAVDLLKRIVTPEFPTHLVERQHGQLRTKGQIDKTMGIIAGGPFGDKIETAWSGRAEGADAVRDVADRLYEGLERLAGTRPWETRPIYRLDLLEQGFVIIGVSGAAIEAKAFEIVHHGDDEARKDLACPGIDHAAAFPIELVVTRDGNDVKTLIVDEMFRMKLYFEDAGKMKFAMNMRMPGSIENEIRDKIEDSLY